MWLLQGNRRIRWERCISKWHRHSSVKVQRSRLKIQFVKANYSESENIYIGQVSRYQAKMKNMSKFVEQLEVQKREALLSRRPQKRHVQEYGQWAKLTGSTPRSQFFIFSSGLHAKTGKKKQGRDDEPKVWRLI